MPRASSQGAKNRLLREKEVKEKWLKDKEKLLSWRVKRGKKKKILTFVIVTKIEKTQIFLWQISALSKNNLQTHYSAK